MFVNKVIAILRCFKVIFNESLNLSLYNNLIKIKLSNFYNKNFYLQNNPDVKTSGMSAIRHFLLFGGFEGRKPSEKFDSASYLSEYPDIKENVMNPLNPIFKVWKMECRATHLLPALLVLLNFFVAKRDNYDVCKD